MSAGFYLAIKQWRRQREMTKRTQQQTPENEDTALPFHEQPPEIQQKILDEQASGESMPTEIRGWDKPPGTRH